MVLFPIGAVGLGVLLANESVTPLFVVGGMLVLVGGYVGALAPVARLCSVVALEARPSSGPTQPS